MSGSDEERKRPADWRDPGDANQAAQEARHARNAERISALCQRLEQARRAEYAGLTRDQLLDLWIDAEELMSWVMAKRLEAMHELQRRRAG